MHKFYLAVIFVLVVLIGLAWAATLPDSLAGFKLGQSMPAERIAKNVTAFGLKGTAHISGSSDGKVERIAFLGAQVYEDGDVELKKMIRDFTKKYGQCKTRTAEKAVWEQNERRLVVTLGFEIDSDFPAALFILESTAENVIGHHNDGFPAFWDKFKKALSADDHDALFPLFRLPFSYEIYNYHDGTATTETISFRNREEFEKVFNLFITAEAKKAITETKTSFDEPTGFYIIPWFLPAQPDICTLMSAERIDGQWFMTGLLFTP